jgi:hypothetical protein
MAIPISNVTRRQVYAPSGSGGIGPYAFTFEILANTDIAVYKDDTLLTLTTHYTVTINANGTGSVTITSAGLALAPTSPTQYAIVGNRTVARSTDFTTGGDFFANTINDELDQQTIFAQQNAEGLSRALSAPQTDPTTIDMTLPRASVRINKILAFDATGNPSATNFIGSNRGNWGAGTLYYVRDIIKDTTNSNIWQCDVEHTSSGSLPIGTNADSAKWLLLVDAAAAGTSATAAASSASAASSSASSASSSASAASTSASNASTSASTATTQASNASTSASNASTSATSAANSAAAAASALDSFDDRYLGTKTSDPTVDNDGNALAAGALYFSTTQNVMKVYDGASWIAATAAGATSLVRFRYVATSGQTTFSGADAASATLTYTVNNTVVMRNGVTLDTSEYTASSGTSVVLNVAAGTGDIIDIIAFKSFTVSDALSATSGGTVNGVVTITGNVGIGVTPTTAWGSAFKAIEGFYGGSVAFFSTGDTPATWFTSNAYNNGTNWIAKITDQAGAYKIEGSTGKHIWSTVASNVTAGSAITFNDAMVLDSSGNLGLGTSSPTTKLNLGGSTDQTIQVNGASTAAFLGVSTSVSQISSNRNPVTGTIYNTGAAVSYINLQAANGDSNIQFYTSATNNTNPSESMRITASGAVGIGTSSPSSKLEIVGVNPKLTINANDSVNGRNATLSLIQGVSSDPSGTCQIMYGASNSTSAGTLTFVEGDGTERARIDSSGKTFINCTSVPYSGTSAYLNVNSNLGSGIYAITTSVNSTASQGHINFVNNNGGVGSISTSASATSFNTSSDYRLKNTIAPMTGALAKVALLKPSTYKWNVDGSNGEGFIAHELAEVVPDCVTGEKDGVEIYTDESGNEQTRPKYQGIDVSFLVATLTAAIQEQQALIETLTQRITALEGA